MGKITFLSVQGIHSGYGDVEVLHGVSLEVEKGEVVAILGPNGAGKTTLLKTIIAHLRPSKGRILFLGEDIGISSSAILRKGISLVPEGSGVFPYMTVQENLEMGAYVIKDRNLVIRRITEIYEMFPELKQRKDNNALTLSGGERTMLALARGLITEPSLLLIDEPSLGLDPKHVQLSFKKLRELHEAGISMLIAEQNAKRALEITHRAYVVESGQVRLSGSSKELMERDDVRRAYLGALITSKT